MKKTLLSVVSLAIFFTKTVTAQTIWNGPLTTFTKVGFTNWTLAANQDRITASTWITRADIEGIFNIAMESDYNKPIHTSPINTEWATGTLANYASLSYQTWYLWANRNPNTTVGVQAVLHLIAENIYIGITFTAWGGGSSGGSFSYQRTTAPITTPVKLVSFVATKKDNKLQLNWKTASEESTSNFSIEKSGDGKEFVPIGSLQAAGNSITEKTYSFTDASPFPSNYYRLKINDNNGTFSYSSIVAFKFGKIKSLEFFPVPACANLNVQVNVATQSIMQVVDIMGRIRKTKNLTEGNNAFNLAIDDLKPGVYFLRVEDDSKMFIKE